MTEERKFAILFAATLLCARKLMEIEDKPSPVGKQGASSFRELADSPYNFEPDQAAFLAGL